MNLNKTINTIALEQKVEIGSAEWIKGGLQGYSGTTGGEAAYGWNHACYLEKYGIDWVKAVIANYGARRCYYLNEPARLFAYENGGRPVGWTPEFPDELPNGETVYLTSKGPYIVSGPDILHFQISPLFTLYDAESYEITAHGQKVSSKVIAGALLSMLGNTLVGEITLKNGKHTASTFGDRGQAIIWRNVAELMARNLLDTSLMPLILGYLTDVALPFYEQGLGLTINEKPKWINGFQNTQLYNGLYWLVPAFYWLYLVTWLPEVRLRIDKIVFRWCNWIKEMEALKPGLASQTAELLLPPELSSATTPPDSLLPYIKPEHLYVPEKSTDWSIWAITAWDIAANITGDSALAKSRDDMVAKWKAKGNLADKPFLCDRNKQYF